MKVLVIGSGMMGSAMAYDLVHSPDVEKIILADIDENRARTVATSLGTRVEPKRLDINQHDSLLALMKSVDVAIGATTYTHNVMLTKTAIEAKIHFCDLGGNMDVVNAQIAMHELAKAAGICILPNCGLAPGMACVVAAEGAKKFSSVDEIHIRVGGLPQHPKPPLNLIIFYPGHRMI